MSPEEKASFYAGVAGRPRIFIDTSAQAQSGQNTTAVSGTNEATLFHWRAEWVKNIGENVKRFGYFNKDHAVKVFARENLNNACVLVGAGPSLAKNMDFLKECAGKKIPIMASAHAFMYLSENGIKPDFVTILDASSRWLEYLRGPSQGVVLFSDWCCAPEYFEKWEGSIYFYQSDFDRINSIQGKLIWDELMEASKNAIPPDTVPVGGHVGGGMVHIAKEILGSSDMIFVGFDYAFLDGKFYPSDKEIDNPSVPAEARNSVANILGMPVETVPSYFMFKSMIDQIVWGYKMADPKISYINATEGGILGAYPQGNLVCFDYMALDDAIRLVTAQREVRMSWGR